MADGAQTSAAFHFPPPSGRDARLSVLITLAPDQLARLLSADPAKAEPRGPGGDAGLPEGQVRFGRMLLEKQVG